jgi:hypothetical protein
MTSYDVTCANNSKDKVVLRLSVKGRETRMAIYSKGHQHYLCA